jgi:uncharacterized protein YodC (DUF2158 family)
MTKFLYGLAGVALVAVYVIGGMYLCRWILE